MLWSGICCPFSNSKLFTNSLSSCLIRVSPDLSSACENCGCLLKFGANPANPPPCIPAVGLTTCGNDLGEFSWFSRGLFDCTANNRKFAVGVQAIKQNKGNRPQISTANSGGSLLMVQSVSGGCKPDSKFAVQSNTPQAPLGHIRLHRKF